MKRSRRIAKSCMIFFYFIITWNANGAVQEQLENDESQGLFSHLQFETYK